MDKEIATHGRGIARRRVHQDTASVLSPAFTRFLVGRAMDRLKAGLQTSTFVVEAATSRCTRGRTFRLGRTLHRSKWALTEQPADKRVTTDRIFLTVSLPLSVASVKSVVQLLGFEICRGHGQSRPVTVINVFGGTPNTAGETHALSRSKPPTIGHRVVGARVAVKSEKCEKSEKSEKSVLPFFRLENAAAQFVPNQIANWGFSDFLKNFRGYRLFPSVKPVKPVLPVVENDKINANLLK